MKHTKEAKRKISENTKRWMKENPDRHPWKSSDKFVSPPCERLKDYFRAKGLQFVPEYSPLFDQGRYFSVDVAFPDKKIGVEINGNQHYDSNGELKPYYQERHRLISEAGWRLYELHFSRAYDLDFLNKVIEEILAENARETFDYKIYIKPKKTDPKICKCGRTIWFSSMCCNQCRADAQQRVSRPTPQVLKELVSKLAITKIAQQFGVSDNAIRKWCEAAGIEYRKRSRIGPVS